MIQFAYANTLFFTIPFICIASFYRLRWRKEIIYRYTLVSYLSTQAGNLSLWPRRILFSLRFCTLLTLALLVAKPQLVKEKLPSVIDGIDIVLALDCSGSMQCFDDLKDQRSRFDVARQEAINFVNKREHDTIGIVIFAQQAVSRCPLTLDKLMLKDLLHDLNLGCINPDGTMLATALLTAANRLKTSQAKSKIIILLTDGEPTPGDIKPEVALNIVKKIGIKVYTIGVGTQGGGFIQHPLFGVVSVQSQFNQELLEEIAHQTGGKFFHATNPTDMKTVYEQIDALEKTKHETLLYRNVQDWFLPLVWLAIFCMIFELVLSLVWFGLWLL